MSSLIDLLETPIDEMSIEQLEERINTIKHLKVTDKKPKFENSNKGKRLKDALKGLDEADFAKLKALIASTAN